MKDLHLAPVKIFYHLFSVGGLGGNGKQAYILL